MKKIVSVTRLYEILVYSVLEHINTTNLLQVTWTKDGKVLKVGGKYEIVYSLGICSLEIQSCEMSDAGRYVCQAENAKGSIETSSKITVDGKS